MKGSNHLQTTIKAYLDFRAETDSLFAVAYAKEGKNIKDCIAYILNTVQKSGCNGFTDDEIYSMAVHYYDEDNIEVGKLPNARVVVNHVVELTEQEKAEARKKAMERAQNDAYAKMMAPKTKAKKTETDTQPSLF